MPELPEVETVVRGLAPHVIGRTIQDVDVRYPGCLLPADGKSRLNRGDAGAFRAATIGRKILNVRRRAKNIVLDLSPGENGPLHLLAHLKMSGALWVPPQTALADAEADTHTHLLFALSGSVHMHFRDPRKFGYVLALTPQELEDRLKSLGPEPLELSPQAFAKRAAGRRRQIKGLLLDQSFIAGVGNIYADEACHRAGIRPDARVEKLSSARLAKLHQAMQDVLAKAIAENGSTFRDYVNAHGEAGAFQNLFLVYGRAGKPCLGCGHTLASAAVAGRTTVYCPQCQKA